MLLPVALHLRDLGCAFENRAHGRFLVPRNLLDIILGLQGLFPRATLESIGMPFFVEGLFASDIIILHFHGTTSCYAFHEEFIAGVPSSVELPVFNYFCMARSLEPR